VLLIDDGHTEVAQIDTLLDQCVRAHNDLRLGRHAPGPYADRARQQRAGHAQLETDRLQGQEVLLRECLRRRHQRTAAPGLDRTQQRVERDDGLPRADVALEEPLHRPLLRQIGVDLRDRLLLVSGQLERQNRSVPRHELAGLTQRRRALLLPPLPAPCEPQLQDE
jgi:hypothetical protein